MIGGLHLAALTPFAAAIAVGYLLGSIPFGLILTRVAGRGDIRRIGSGNIGATNVLRTGNPWLALTTLLLDGVKGAAAVMLAALHSPMVGLVAGAAAVVGHVFPIWLGFRGGKGVATTLGALLAAAPLAGAAALLTWIAVAALGRISSLSALVTLAAAPLYAWALGGPKVALALLAISLLVVWRHEDNIRRLLRGEEPKIGASKGG